MRAFNRFAVILGLALAAAQAQAMQPVAFSLASSPSSNGTTPYTATDTATGLTITATAWSSPAGSSQFAQAALTVAADGMGVCNASELNCTPGNLGSLGNNAGNDLILFRFNAPVDLQGLSIGPIGGVKPSFSVWAGTSTLPADTLLANLGTATQFSVAANQKNEVPLKNYFTGYYDWFAVAALIGGTNDLAKLQSLTVKINPQAQPVPEPDTWIMLLAGLGLVGFAVSRRTQA